MSDETALRRGSGGEPGKVASVTLLEGLDPVFAAPPSLPTPGPVPRERPAPRRRMLRSTLRERLTREPARFTFDAAVAAMMHATGRADPGAAVRYHALPGLSFVGADVLAAEPAGDHYRAVIGMLGLTGPGGLLPRPYTAAINTEQRRRSTALGAFLDLLAQRALAQFAAAGIKYRLHRLADAAAIDARSSDRPDASRRNGLDDSLLALTGHATPGLAERLPMGTDPLFFYAGAFAARPRSADRLAAILSDWLGQVVEVEQFAGRWLDIDPGQRTGLPRAECLGQFNQLGVDAVIGTRTWDIQSCIVLRVGPLRLDAFSALLPGGETLRRLTALARAYLDAATAFRINPVLAADAVPPLVLDRQAPARLGWNSWLPTERPRRLDAREASFASNDPVIDTPATGPVA